MTVQNSLNAFTGGHMALEQTQYNWQYFFCLKLPVLLGLDFRSSLENFLLSFLPVQMFCQFWRLPWLNFCMRYW